MSNTECRRCSECVDQEHHFLPHEYDDADGNGHLYYPCKHCDARAWACDSCDVAFWPAVDASGLCPECKEDAERDDEP
jgi:hypothetical protein